MINGGTMAFNRTVYRWGQKRGQRRNDAVPG